MVRSAFFGVERWRWKIDFCAIYIQVRKNLFGRHSTTHGGFLINFRYLVLRGLETSVENVLDAGTCLEKVGNWSANQTGSRCLMFVLDTGFQIKWTLVSKQSGDRRPNKTQATIQMK